MKRGRASRLLPEGIWVLSIAADLVALRANLACAGANEIMAKQGTSFNQPGQKGRRACARQFDRGAGWWRGLEGRGSYRSFFGYPDLIVFLAENLKRAIRFPNRNSMWQIIGQSVWTIGLNGRFSVDSLALPRLQFPRLVGSAAMRERFTKRRGRRRADSAGAGDFLPERAGL